MSEHDPYRKARDTGGAWKRNQIGQNLKEKTKCRGKKLDN